MSCSRSRKSIACNRFLAYLHTAVKADFEGPPCVNREKHMKSAPIVVFATLGLVLISGTLLAGPKQKTNAGKKTYTGTVTDTVCGTKHMMKDMDDAQCARMCVEHGAD